MRKSRGCNVLAMEGAAFGASSMSIRCLLGFHHRSGRHARHDAHGLISKCARCGIPMEKDGSGLWIVMRGEAERAEEAKAGRP